MLDALDLCEAAFIDVDDFCFDDLALVVVVLLLEVDDPGLALHFDFVNFCFLALGFCPEDAGAGADGGIGRITSLARLARPWLLLLPSLLPPLLPPLLPCKMTGTGTTTVTGTTTGAGKIKLSGDTEARTETEEAASFC